VSSISENLQQIKNQIHEGELRYARQPHSVSLLAVSKNQSISAIEAAYQAGQYAFGENYLQEALTKMAALPYPELEWHFIGPIQSNKTKKIAEHFQWVHSICDAKTAARLNSQRPDHLPDVDALLLLAQECVAYPHLQLRGLMAIPAEKNIFADQRAECHKLKLLFEILCKKGLKLDTLSMGMSSDLDAAIAEGSTMVRIGTKIFGGRK
jgi:uncharacterized pyridoxal phosphate-containing UPF0001 family protein